MSALVSSFTIRPAPEDGVFDWAGHGAWLPTSGDGYHVWTNRAGVQGGKQSNRHVLDRMEHSRHVRRIPDAVKPVGVRGTQ